MNATATTSTTLKISSGSTWIFIAALIAGNIILPQACHLIPDGGFIFLPIYFFTLIGAWRYGWQVGVLTALLSPMVNSLFFGMPAPEVVPVIALKGLLLALAAAWTAHRIGKATIAALVAVVFGAQIVGCAIESLILWDIYAGIQDLRIGLPGIALQIFGGYLILKK